MIKLKKAFAALSAAAVGMSLLAAMPASAADSSTMTAEEIIKAMGTGWNLGNSLDAVGTGLGSETIWGNPKTTKALIEKIHSLGFETVRVPVTWGRHMNENYEIDASWLARVKEVVDYAYDDGMYVILNIHHDNDIPSTTQAKNELGSNFFYPSEDYKDQSIKFVTSVWTQVSEEFKDYDQHLIFETLNEPRLTGDANEWWFTYDKPQTKVKTAMELMNQYNQAGVDAIRASGGNNATRLITCPGYGAGLDGARHSYYKVPDDESGMIATTVHAYSPYNFAMNGDTKYSAYDDATKKELYDIFAIIRRDLLDKGRHVIIDEMGATNKENSAERAKWAKDFKAFSELSGAAIVVWDNNVYNKDNNGYTEKYGVIDRRTLADCDPVYTSALTSPTGVTEMWDGGVITSQPTTTAAGVKTYTDVATGATRTESIAKLIDLSGADVTASTSNLTYTGLAVRPNVTVKLSGKTLKKDTDYTVGYSNNLKAGDAKIIINGTGLYGGKIEIPFTIKAVDASKITVSELTEAAYTGKAVTPEVSVKYGTKVLKQDTDYTLSYKNNTAVGAATVTVTLTGNYTGSISKTFNIVDGVAKATVKVANKVYTGKALKPAPTVKLNGKTLKKGTDYTVSYKNNVKVGKATVTITGKGFYKGTVSKTFKINPKATTAKKLTSPKTKQAKITYKKVANVSGYQIAYSTSKNFTKATTKYVSSTTTSKILKKLKKGKTIYVKVRTFKKVGGVKYYSAYSKVLKVKVK